MVLSWVVVFAPVTLLAVVATPNTALGFPWASKSVRAGVERTSPSLALGMLLSSTSTKDRALIWVGTFCIFAFTLMVPCRNAFAHNHLPPAGATPS